MTRSEIQLAVQRVLQQAAAEGSGASAFVVNDSSHLLTDLGLTSLNLAEVAIGIEETLGLSEFPVSDWLKAEAQRTDSRALTVGSLVDACLVLAANSTAKGASPSEPVSNGSEPRRPAVTRSASDAHTAAAWFAAALIACATVAAAVLASR
jgi:acyl carrier protein